MPADSSTPVPAPGAVFLSYAHEDTGAARRIADALRGFGIQVWFDQHELRGGDAWDAKIRHQIRNCALFLPVISASTQARSEGYFRREWKVAVDRTQDMHEAVPFIVPVVIDDTTESTALVPEPFLRVQWTRLPGGEPTAQFVEQVKHLLEPPRKAAASEAVPAPRAPIGDVNRPAAPEPGPSLDPRLPGWMWAAFVVAALGLVGGWYFLRNRPASVPATTVADASAKAATPVDKSIAVLPFTNLSDDKGNGYFADGVQYDILTSLRNIGDLKVIAHTSVEQYRDTKKTIRQIGEELGVAYVLEGSVQRAGDTVHVTGQLIDAHTEGNVWAQHYDRQVELEDIFAVQSALAEEIAVALKAKISPQEKSRLETRPTNDMAAYDLYLQGRDISRHRTNSRENVAQAQSLLEQVVRRDPRFALAWAELAHVHFLAYARQDHSPARLAKAKDCVETATRLAPDDLEVLLQLAIYHQLANDFERSNALIRQIVAANPNNATAILALSRAEQRADQWTDSLAHVRKAVALDPRSIEALTQLGNLLGGLRHYDEAEKVLREAYALQPPNFARSLRLAGFSFSARGATEAGDALLATVTPEMRRTDPEVAIECARYAYATKGDAAEVIRLWEEAGPNWRFNPNSTADDLFVVATAFLKLGQTARARPLLERARDQMKTELMAEPENGAKWLSLAEFQAALGEKEAALELVPKVRALLARSRNTTPAEIRESEIAVIYAWAGEKDLALAELALVLRAPFSGSVYGLRHLIALWPLQGDPRFEALLNDPRNSAPLF